MSQNVRFKGGEFGHVGVSLRKIGVTDMLLVTDQAAFLHGGVEQLLQGVWNPFV